MYTQLTQTSIIQVLVYLNSQKLAINCFHAFHYNLQDDGHLVIQPPVHVHCMLLVFFSPTVFMLVLMLEVVMVLLALRIISTIHASKQPPDQRGLDNLGCTVRAD